MFTCLAYSDVFAGAANLQDATAAADPDFSRRNGHYIFSEPYNLIAAAIMGATNTAAEFNVPSINAIAKHNIYPPMTALAVPSNPNLAWYGDYPPQMPVNEEVAILLSSSGAETESAFIWLGTPDWNQNLPRGIRRMTVLATVTITTVANQWASNGSIAFETALRGGVYSIVGASLLKSTGQAFRINFVRQPLYSGRKMRPGSLCTATYGNVPLRPYLDMFGEWGRFHTFEPPTIDLFDTASAAVTPSLLLDVIYLGTDLSLLGVPGALSI